MRSAFDCSGTVTDTATENLISDVEDDKHVENQDSLDSADASAPSRADQLIEEIHKQGLSDLVDMLRFLQKELVQRHDLDMTSESELRGNEPHLHRQT